MSSMCRKIGSTSILAGQSSHSKRGATNNAERAVTMDMLEKLRWAAFLDAKAA